MKSLVLILVLLFACAPTPPPGPHPQLILYGGRIYTQSRAGVVEAIALEEGRVLAIGSSEQIMALAGPKTEAIALQGRAVYPGFADSHAHLLGIGQAVSRLDLSGTRSFQEVLALVAKRDQELPAGAWLLARGWDQNDWPEPEFPDHRPLSSLVPQRPVLLERVDGHMLLANAAAMDAAGLTQQTLEPEGGRIGKLANGELSGIFQDQAEALFDDAIPKDTPEAIEHAILAAQGALHRQGITQFHDAGVSAEVFRVLEKMCRENTLQLRLHEMVEGADSAWLNQCFQRGPLEDVCGNGILVLRAVKLYADGALGSRGAALLEPYSDDLKQRGLILNTIEELQTAAEQCLEKGFQLCVHAIGDRAVRQTLDAYQAASAVVQERLHKHRFRIEHAQVIHPDDIPRFFRLGVIPSMQTQHQTSDMDWAEQRLGPQRILGAYAWRSLLDRGCIIPGGSDAPVEQLDVVAEFAAACTRKNLAGEPDGGCYPQQKMSREEALQMLTTWPAIASFREHDLGQLAPGFRADLVVFSRDLMMVPQSEWDTCFPELTIFAGQVVWKKEKAH